MACAQNDSFIDIISCQGRRWSCDAKPNELLHECSELFGSKSLRRADGGATTVVDLVPSRQGNLPQMAVKISIPFILHIRKGSLKVDGMLLH